MKHHPATPLDLGPIDQVGYVVHDLDASLPAYEALFGPFEIMDAPMEDCTFRGEQIACRLRIAMNRSGPIEIELIEVIEGETPHTEHLRRCGEGPHHVRFIVDDLDAKLVVLEAAGYRNVFQKRFGPGLAFAYVETPKALGPSLIELFENRAATA
jgi:methylmalonyl-CoA/ethylmalonyl-CoA epimerase